MRPYGSVRGSVTAGVLQPLLAPVVLLSALPRGWASVRSARLMFASFLRMNSLRRRLAITSVMITARDRAAEVRAFTTRGVLLGEHRRIAATMTRRADGARRHLPRAVRPAGPRLRAGRQLGAGWRAGPGSARLIDDPGPAP